MSLLINHNKIKESFDQFYAIYDGNLVDKYFPAYLKWMKLREKVLDIGCGTGVLVKSLRSMRKKAYGIDLSKVAVRKANVPYIIEGSITNIPYPDDFFDTVGCHWVLEHVEDVDKAVKEMIRVTKIGGHIVVYTVNFTNLVDVFSCRVSVKKALRNFLNILEYLLRGRAFVYSGPYLTEHGTFNGSKPVLSYFEKLVRKLGCDCLEKISIVVEGNNFKAKFAAFIGLSNIGWMQNFGPNLFLVARKTTWSKKSLFQRINVISNE